MEIKVYQFNVNKPRPAGKADKPAAFPTGQAEEKEIEVMTPIQGRMPGSKEEWRTAKALDMAHLSYRYQYQVDGGRLPGGQIIDFLVYTAPVPTPLYVQGEYWHGGKRSLEDAIKQAKVTKILGGKVKRPVLFWAADLPSVDAAFMMVKRHLL